MKLRSFVFTILNCVFFLGSLTAQEASRQLDRVLPVDSKITVGQLDNGLKYYIRENQKPEARAELRLVINAGSVLEDADQRGLAHFVEHMAFNGTKNFARQEIVDYLESIGMQFGPDINAYTSFDQTVYMLQIPTDSVEVVATAFRVLEDWAHHISFDSTEIEKERGVVIEEWRLGRGANARLRDQQFPVLFADSRYAERLPIGKKEILESAPREAFLRFYEDWYRPDLMAVVAVGDFDARQIEDLIHEHFSRLESPEQARERKLFPVPDHQETLFAIASDPEATNSDVSIYYKHEPSPEGTEGDYRRMLVASLYNRMLNNRLNELLKNPNPPFLFAYSNEGQLIRTKAAYILAAVVKDNGIETGLANLLTEAARVRRHGFTASELEREKAEMLSAIEQAFNERDKTESARYAAEYIRNFLTDEPIPGIEYEFMLYNKYLPGIALQEVNRLAEQWIRDQSRVVVVSLPEKDGVRAPDKSDLEAVFEQVERRDLQPYVDAVSDEPLVSAVPTSGQIVAESRIDTLNVTEWRLSNGALVVLKATDFKNDEILFTATSPGGHSLISDEHYVAAVSASSIVSEGGLGNFDEIALQKKLAGKIANVSPWLGELQEGLSGSASPKDIETLFQLIHLYFTSPRKDSTAFLAFQERIRGLIANRHANPQAAFQDTVRVTMADYHIRSRPWSDELIDEMDLEKSFRIYQDRFSDAGDFTFFFVGNFDYEVMRPLVETYLASLPTFNRSETWRDVGVYPPKGVIQKTVHKGIEPKSRVSIIFTGPFQWTRQNRHAISSMADVLEIKLREVLREDLGGTYGVGVYASTAHYPSEEYSVNISFGCAPERVGELTETVFQQIDSLRDFGATQKYLDKVKEQQRRSRETNLKKNQFWLRTLSSYYFHQEDPINILTFDDLIATLTLKDVQDAARQYLNKENYVMVSLFPEQTEKSNR